MKICLLILFTFWSFIVPVQAEIYKWTDAEGRVHFGDKAPQNESVSQIDLPKIPAPDNVPDSTEREHLERQKRLVKALEEDRLEKEQAKIRLREEEEKKAVYCERFRNRIERLDASNHVYSENKDGTIRYWNDQDADRYRAEQHALFEKECAGM